MRKIEITDSNILKILSEKAVIGKKQAEIAKETERLEKEFNKNMAKYTRIDEKIRPLITGIVSKLVLGEYEQLSWVHEDEKSGKWIITIADRMEEFKEAWKHKDDVKEIKTTS